MKFLVTIAFIGLYVATTKVHAAIPEEELARLKAVRMECLAEVPNINQENLAKYRAHEFVEGDDNLKKLAFCFQKKMKMQNEDGSFNVQGTKDALAKMYGNNDHDKDVDECTKVDTHNGLDNAWELVKCLMGKLVMVGHHMGQKA